MEIFFGILLACFIADLFSGFIHFLIDSYGNEDWQFSKNRLKYWLYVNVVKDNLIHHQRPAAFLEGSYWYRNWTTIIPALFLASLFYLLWPNFWPLWIGCLIMTQSNQLHAFSHYKANWFIRLLQNCYILQSPKQHKVHHTKPYSNSYLVIFPWFNPILEFIYFWAIARIIIWLITGAKPLEQRKIY